jgi:hypothetical protein
MKNLLFILFMTFAVLAFISSIFIFIQNKQQVNLIFYVGLIETVCMLFIAFMINRKETVKN